MTDQGPTMPEATEPSQAEPLSAYDLRLRSLDEPCELHLCTLCDAHAFWSVWLHTPEWGRNGGSTSILCTPCALASVRIAAADHDPRGDAMTDMPEPPVHDHSITVNCHPACPRWVFADERATAVPDPDEPYCSNCRAEHAIDVSCSAHARDMVSSVETAEDLLGDVARSVVENDDLLLSYVTVRIDRWTWRDIQARYGTPADKPGSGASDV